MEKLDFGKLNTLWEQGEAADSRVLSEMRTSVLLYSGDHYKKTQEKMIQRLKDSSLQDTQRLRLVKNHIQSVCNKKIDNIVSLAPDVAPFPFNESDMNDCKEAELSTKMADDMKYKQNWRGKIDQWAFDFVVASEVASFCYFHPNKGRFLGYQQKVSEEGHPLFDHPQMGEMPAPVNEMGQPVPPEVHGMKPTADKTKPKFEGQVVIDVIFPGDIRRPSSAESIAEAPWLGFQKMVPIDEAKRMVKDEDIADRLAESANSTFKVFDSVRSEYVDTKGQARLRWIFFRPCADYPMGWFTLLSDSDILAEDELPFGVFPMEHEIYDSISKSPRGKGCIKDMKPSQQNINMLASKRAEHTLTIGDDKIITSQGAKMQKGESWNGIREWKINGQAPTVLPGRTGDQFAAPLQEEIAELYKLGGEQFDEPAPAQQDPWASLFANAKQKLKYSRHAQKFERFLGRTLATYLKLAKRYYPDDYVARAIGRNEVINMAEFRRIDDDGFNIKVKPVNDDINSTYGKVLMFQQILQYVGKDMPPEILGVIMKDMPFINANKAISLLVVDVDNIESDILCLDRGQYRPAREGDKHELFLKALQSRMRKPDFSMMGPQIAELYKRRIQEHIQMKSAEEAELMRQEAGMIPCNSGLVKIDLYDTDGHRMTLPQDALQWLADMLAKQGSSQQALGQLEQKTQADILAKAHQMVGSQPQQMGFNNGTGQTAGTQPVQPMPLTAH